MTVAEKALAKFANFLKKNHCNNGLQLFNLNREQLATYPSIAELIKSFMKNPEATVRQQETVVPRNSPNHKP